MKDDRYQYTAEQQEELGDWLDSLDELIDRETPERVRFILRQLQTRAFSRGIRIPFSANTPYVNTIPHDQEPMYPGNRDLERRIRSIIRWNAMAMVVRGNKHSEGIGGHISTYASAATLYEVGYNHFFRGPNHPSGGDFVYFQGHASPGIYSRAFLEGRLSQTQLENFRREMAEEGGLSSYPHPRLMPDFWQFPTVSLGIGPLTAIYHARFIRYLEDRGLKEPTDQKIWCFIGDGEVDEPETLGAITLPAREKLDNLIFVINCNLQRLDGPVRGNGKIIQELEAAFRGAGWRVVKVVWGGDWDPLFERDDDGVLVQRMGEIVDGQYQKYSVSSGSYIREHVCNGDARLQKLFSQLTDEQLRTMRRGGHDTQKVYAAYHEAVSHRGSPTVILAKTIKGYGLGESGEGKNITHQQKKLNEDELREFRTRFGIPIDDDDVAFAPFYMPPDESPELKYLRARREELGGPLPSRKTEFNPLPEPDWKSFDEFNEGTGERSVSTTMVYVRVLSKLLTDKGVGKHIVPIVPDEARTFGMEALFRQVGIYSHVGQLYEPVDATNLLYYKEATDGQILEEGITEAGSISSFIAAGTAYANHGVTMAPFYIYYSMFGPQRIGDLIWAAGDAKCRGFLLGATAGRTTLNGEGLQHQDGHSHLLAYPYPNLRAYDPAYAFELAAIVKDGFRRMFINGEDWMYYLTVGNENYPMPHAPEGVEEGILKGLYKFKPGSAKKGPKAHLLGSGAIMQAALEAQKILEEKYGVNADVWSVTSYKELYREATCVARQELLDPKDKPRVPYVTECLSEDGDVVVAASDYVRALPDSISKWVPKPMVSLGTDGFGMSETRENLRAHFEVDARYIALAALRLLAREGKMDKKVPDQAVKDFGIDPNKPDPAMRVLQR